MRRALACLACRGSILGTAGTTLSDFLDRSAGLGYAKGSFILMSLQVGGLAVWH